MTSNAQVIDRWLDVVEGRSTRLVGTRRSNTVYAEGNAVYSYGPHFPMAEHYGTQTGGFYVVNGDRYSVTTSRHQGDVRGAIGNRTRIIVPFSAMDGAGIDRSAVEIIDVTEDSYVEHKRESVNLDDVPKHSRTHYVSNPHDETCDEKRARVGYCYHGGESVEIEPDADGIYRWTESEHRLGASLFRARYSRQRQGKTCRGPFTIPTGPEYVHPREACRHGMTREHVIMVREHGRGTFLSAWDSQESRPVYYLAQLSADAVSVADAVEGLKPEAVREADRNGTAYVRQGDVFAVEAAITTAELREAGAKIYRRAWLTNPRGIDVSGPVVKTRDDLGKLRRIIALEDTNHQATMVAKVEGRTYAKGCLYHAPAGRNPDHGRRRIGNGKTWAMVALNTVERSFGVARAWSARGNVD